ncbi:MAG: TRAP transporter small permease subunit, partial [Methylobacteriaceae bacterium]|nr:TRAP transporter small permease subunit [Methylobacteriaceae bacterium]
MGPAAAPISPASLRVSKWARIAAVIDISLVRSIEIIAAALVALETAILFAGVVSRYLVHQPLTWSDELASILFLWLAMLGAVVAYARGEHMR